MADVILVFKSVHETLKAEKLLNNTQLVFQVVPVPPFVNEGCGLGIKVAEGQLEEAKNILLQEGIAPLKTVQLGKE